MSNLLLLRHGEAASHQGDVSLTEAGRTKAMLSGKALAASIPGLVTVLYGGTRRTRETAEAIVAGMNRPDLVAGPLDAFALRNPDLYVAGTRVEMVSTAAALAAQVPGMTEAQAASHPWFSSYFAAPDPIGWWLGQSNPPGDSASAVSTRIQVFACSLDDVGPTRDHLILGITHSPVLRSVIRAATGHDPGPPVHVTGAMLHATASGIESVETFVP